VGTHRRAALVCLVAAALLPLAGGGAAAGAGTGSTVGAGAAVRAGTGGTTGVGSTGLGDGYFPHAGNGGYDVGHYDLTLDYSPATDVLAGTARIRAVATAGLSRFSLDLRGMGVSGVAVNGRAAAYARSGPELLITPAYPLARGSRFEVVVRYAGVPRVLTDGSARYGFLPTDDGAYVAAEPDGASTWFPANDHPRDKATFTFRVTVPRGLAALANGRLASRHTSGETAT